MFTLWDLEAAGGEGVAVVAGVYEPAQQCVSAPDAGLELLLGESQLKPTFRFDLSGGASISFLITSKTT